MSGNVTEIMKVRFSGKEWWGSVNTSKNYPNGSRLWLYRFEADAKLGLENWAHSFSLVFGWPDGVEKVEEPEEDKFCLVVVSNKPSSLFVFTPESKWKATHRAGGLYVELEVSKSTYYFEKGSYMELILEASRAMLFMGDERGKSIK